MPKKTYTPEQIVTKLSEIEVLTNQGASIPPPVNRPGSPISAPLEKNLNEFKEYDSRHRVHAALLHKRQIKSVPAHHPFRLNWIGSPGYPTVAVCFTCR